jgi:hypothetical protein
MDRIIWVAIFVIVLFVLTYDPNTKTLEKYIMVDPIQRVKENKGKLCCGSNDYRADHPQQCENAYYRGVQFANLDIGCPPKPNLVEGVITAKDETLPGIKTLCA